MSKADVSSVVHEILVTTQKQKNRNNNLQYFGIIKREQKKKKKKKNPQTDLNVDTTKCWPVLQKKHPKTTKLIQKNKNKNIIIIKAQNLQPQ